MTRIHFKSEGDRYSFFSIGHTGYDTSGRDILCSAVSMLCFTLDRHLSKLFAEGSITNYGTSFEDGMMRAGFSLPELCDKKAVLSGIESILQGFTILEEAYPRYIKANIELSI